jgi:sensor c-di-GMP phosphodiesterase-like protein
MMSLRRSHLIQLASVTAALLAFAVGGHFAATTVIGQQRAKQLTELTDVALRRSEVAVDYGARTLGDVARRGMDCDAAALQAVRLQVYQRSAVKDIRSVNRDGSVICSAYSETLEFDNGLVERGEMSPARDRRLLLFRVDQINGIALGVLRDIDDKKSLVAILGIDSYVFDIMPAELREHSEVALALSNGANVGRFTTLEKHGDSSSRFSFSQDSTRYPLRATITIDAAAFQHWNSEAYWPIMLLAVVLGIPFGLLLARALIGAGGPVADLDRAMDRGEFKPFFQPTFDLRSGAVVGCEALARWVHDDGSIVPPMSFIPLAESSGRIERMTWQILAKALAELQPRMRADKHFKLSFNVVPRHLLSDGFVEKLRGVVADAKVSPRQIVLEVTERDELPDLEAAAAVVTQLREFGFRVAMDDVGVGHSGLSQMKGLGANTIKIDKFFVDTITGGGAALTIVEMLVRLARDLKMTVVAEGIESAEQVAALLACGVEEGQGYIVSPPLPFARFDQLLRQREEAATAMAAQDAALVA